MDRDSFTETVLAFMNRRPFRPFTIVTMSGNRHDVDLPSALAVREGLALFAGPARVPVIFDSEGVSEVIGDLPGREAEASGDQQRVQRWTTRPCLPSHPPSHDAPRRGTRPHHAERRVTVHNVSAEAGHHGARAILAGRQRPSGNC